MYNGYHKQNNFHALQQLNKAVHIPVARLGIGDGENLQAHGMKVEIVQGKQTVVIPDLNTHRFEQAHIDGQGASLSEKDFPKTGYMGEAIGGI